PRMNHDRAALQVGELEPGRQDRLARAALLVDVQRRQVAEMPVAPGRAMPAGTFRVEMPARGPGRRGLAVDLLRAAVGFLVHMEAVHAGRQPLELGREDEADLPGQFRTRSFLENG